MVQITALLFGLFTFGIGSAFGQTDYSNRYKEIGLTDGLSQSTISSIVQDSLGYLWIGTADGLNRYDGYDFRVYSIRADDSTSISDNWITDLHIDRHHRLWIATEHGLNRYNYSDQTFTRYLPSSTQNSIVGSYIYDLAEDSLGNLWIGTDAGISRFHIASGSFHNFSHLPDDSTTIPTNETYRLAADDQQNIWVGTTNGGVFALRYPDYTVSRLPTGALPDSLPDPYISALNFAPNGRLMIGTFLSGIYEYDPKSEKIAHLYDVSEEPVSLKYHYVRSFDQVGDSMLAATKDGIRVYDYSSGSAYDTDLITLDFLEANPPNLVYSDAGKNLWIGSDLSGLALVNRHIKPFETINQRGPDKRSLSNPIVWSFHEDSEGNIWVATDNGVNVIPPDGSDFKHYQSIDKRDKEYLLSAETSVVTGNQEYIWVGTIGGGLNELDRSSDTFTYYYDQNTDNQMLGFNVLSMHLDRDENLWVGTYKGLTRYNPANGTFTPFKVNTRDTTSKSANTVWSISESNTGDIWVASGSGVYRMNMETEVMERIDLSSSRIVARDANSSGYNAIYFDPHGYAWITTAHGIIIYRENEGIITSIDENDGLSNNFVYNAVQGESDDVIWVSTNKGLSRIKYDPADPSSHEIATFDQTDGIGGDEFNAEAVLKDSKGRIWFGGLHGATRFDPAEISLNTVPPKVVISEMKTINRGTTQTHTVLSERNVEIDYNENVLFIDMAVIDFINPPNNSYKYRLKGFNESWIEGSGKPTVIYTNLSPGEYTFEAQGANSDGTWNPKTASLNITVVPPFYRTARFYVAISFLGLFGLILGVRYREKSHRRQKEILEQEVKKQTSELRQSEEIFRQISDRAGELISMLDHEGRIIYSNPSHKHILGYSPGELIGTSVFKHVHPDDSEIIKNETSLLQKQGHITYSECRLRHKNGEWRTFRASGSIIESDHLEDNRIVVVSHDITRQKQIQENLIASRNEAERANQAKSAFLAGISHELRTPLNAILGFSQILQKDTNLTQRQISYIDTMMKSGKHLLEMINEVLDISKIEANRISFNYDSFSLKSVTGDMKEIFKLQALEKGLNYQLFTAEELPETIFTDVGKLRQIMINLIGNAVKFTENGSVTVRITPLNSVQMEQMNTDRLLAEWESDYSEEADISGLSISVNDTGRGISNEHLEYIFEPFQQVLEHKNYTEGTGLGLAISSKLAELLGGTITVESRLGEGSEFTLLLPVLISKEPSLVVTRSDATRYRIANGERASVLIVDDITYNITLLKELLEPVGFITAGARNGKEALEMAETFAPDLILMDLKMPVMDGETAMRKLREQNALPDTKIIAISASGFDETRNEMMEAGFDEFIHKPFREEQLMSKIADLMDLSFEEETVRTSANSDTLEAEFRALEPQLRKELIDAVDLIDWNQLRLLLPRLEAAPTLYAKLNVSVEEEHYMGIVKLGEKLSEINA